MSGRLGLLKKVWKALDKVPDCPTCKGTGEPYHEYASWAEPVYWKGKIVFVCHHCKGSGKG